ncbi:MULTISPECIES: bifunctional DNA-formamidopyrimidine glycosylase/DNA-(apurinic or apyrimidinic site) lyase [unclassified Neisseria]|uniref:bifunctional DNA-formamidopyrimidine glycosylase/DNA-(apurinic or apyrimidinic site) lyase n=1 Tax=unclassified Neisseria TaxID=2623750 RepID=UPI002666F084|nr:MULTISPECIES: bifunctional DNA-formamidopyrimidine glycosylase/DNA-(apurinic or apyrimidinic site) lyase [unclassified Neisseria]MDO1510249.1 bifunctional DNA-formamidopyrimidine glycosylase/DNA-(apurinic or apyrimidinic site) lyase [Neisseria sp. MVDL19-042950]MDO1516418.1 bifunctional DNA-formamidopyrimidine glycosylase/DNA-(apurinic or apyrimidinic site) lyase [Neisseria sp. MVDL18-041461]MDO1563566.1 bifunctional DNA-formamidopyrimidine glycosylase/DNA-(apurinic or apyrimidinic site) lyas
MPELPEVETVLRGISPHISGQTVNRAVVRQPKLRFPVTPDLNGILHKQKVLSCSRRAKYLLIRFDTGVLLIHLGMSGSLRILTAGNPAIDEIGKHDHVDIVFDNGTVLRYHDPRRFGMVLWFAGAAEHHPLLAALGPEPFESQFDAAYLYSKLHTQKRAVKLALMDNAVVVGIGNIYANESLFKAGISPKRPANKITKQECVKLVETIQAVLNRAIATGGSTLRDFVDSNGQSGYFQQEYTVYGRHNEPCIQCGKPIQKETLGQRGTFYCSHCQK